MFVDDHIKAVCTCRFGNLRILRDNDDMFKLASVDFVEGVQDQRFSLIEMKQLICLKACAVSGCQNDKISLHLVSTVLFQL